MQYINAIDIHKVSCNSRNEKKEKEIMNKKKYIFWTLFLFVRMRKMLYTTKLRDSFFAPVPVNKII